MYKVSQLAKLSPWVRSMSEAAWLGLSAAALLCTSACTLDNLVVLKHPAGAGKGDVFAVGVMNIIVDVNPASRIPDSIFRDSVHFAVGLPSGWEVLSVKACPAPHFRPLRA